VEGTRRSSKEKNKGATGDAEEERRVPFYLMITARIYIAKCK
jgi:hypothetical protein